MLVCKNVKISVFLLLIVGSILSLGIDHVQADTIQQFKVSAYYSPLPNQKQYVSGNYIADLRINGNGTHGADGTPVYVGMISAPSKYAFGTKIYLPGLGIGTVHDRGGAIIAGKNYDRLDIWMGYGDKGRIRAITWGSKMVTGKIIDSSPSLQNTSQKNISSIKKKSSLSRKIFFNTPLSSTKKNMPKIAIKRMQKFLRKQKVYKGRITGKFDTNTKQSVIAFQMNQKIISSPKDDGAGYWGPKTRQKANRLKKIKKFASIRF